MHLGPLLKQELRKKGYFFKFVSNQTGIPYGTLSHYLSGARPMPESKVRLICLTFGISLKKFEF